MRQTAYACQRTELRKGMNDIYATHLKNLEAESRLRVIPDSITEGMIDFTSNDYLGLARRWSDFREEFMSRYPDASFSASASRLLATDQRYHNMLERMLGDLYRKDVLLFNSGYHANVGAISALALPGTLLLSDRLAHASMIDGIRLSKCDFRRWNHNDITDLIKNLDRFSGNYSNIIVIAESVYSMDGDIAPLAQLVEIKKRYPNVMLYIDEAHALGVFGETGLGVADSLGLTDDIDILVGTFGKALASSGAFIATSPMLKKYLLNTARSFIFSTALPPVTIAWTTLMLEKMAAMSAQRENLRLLSEILREGITEITGFTSASSSQIIPLMCGSAELAVDRAGRLREEGFLTLPIRRPTVAPGSERIRLSLSADMKKENVMALLSSVNKIIHESI